MKNFTIALLGLVSLTAFGRGTYNILPTASFYPTPNGILFPNIAAAGGVNAAALPLAGKATVVQGAYTKVNSSASELYGGVGMTSRKFGVSLGYLGDKIGNNLVHNSYAGAGFAIDAVSLGINVRRFDWSGTSSTGVDLGLIAGEGKGFTWGLVVYNLNSNNNSTRLTGGIGFGGGKKYNMELNFTLPPFNGGSVYVITAAGTINPSDAFGVHFKTSYYSDKNYLHVLGLSVFPWENTGFLVQFTSPSIWTGGINLSF